MASIEISGNQLYVSDPSNNYITVTTTGTNVTSITLQELATHISDGSLLHTEVLPPSLIDRVGELLAILAEGDLSGSLAEYAILRSEVEEKFAELSGLMRALDIVRQNLDSLIELRHG